MTDLELSEIGEFRDAAAINRYQIMTERLGVPVEAALQDVIDTTRDRCRSPMQWENAPNAGFCPAGVTPWLRVNENYREGANVADQEGDVGSMLHFYRRLIRLRQETPALMGGDYRPVLPQHEDVLAFLRVDAGSGQGCLVALNFSAEEQVVDLGLGPGKVLFSGRGREEDGLDLDELVVGAFEVLIVGGMPIRKFGVRGAD